MELQQIWICSRPWTQQDVVPEWQQSSMTCSNCAIGARVVQHMAERRLLGSVGWFGIASHQVHLEAYEQVPGLQTNMNKHQSCTTLVLVAELRKI